MFSRLLPLPQCGQLGDVIRPIKLGRKPLRYLRFGGREIANVGGVVGLGLCPQRGPPGLGLGQSPPEAESFSLHK